jgi:hypothetical protein
VKIHAHRSSVRTPPTLRESSRISTSNSIIAVGLLSQLIHSDREFAVQQIERKSQLRGEIG